MLRVTVCVLNAAKDVLASITDDLGEIFVIK